MQMQSSTMLDSDINQMVQRYIPQRFYKLNVSQIDTHFFVNNRVGLYVIDPMHKLLKLNFVLYDMDGPDVN